MLLSQAVLDREQCQDPECTEDHSDVLFLTSGCHPHSPVIVSYIKSRGVLHVKCAQCEAEVGQVKVAAT